MGSFHYHNYWWNFSCSWEDVFENNEICLSFECSFFTNTLILPVINGPTEGLMLIYMCHFFTFLVGMYVCFEPQCSLYLIRKWVCTIAGIFLCTFPIISKQAVCVFHTCLGAEWWVQLFGKSFPILAWVPYFSGKVVEFVFFVCLFSCLTSAFMNLLHHFISLLVNFTYIFSPFEFRNSNIQSCSLCDDSFWLHTNCYIQVRGPL